jgi:hypothetical protein
MSNQVNYKQKYEELKMKYMQDVDTAFRLGFEQGTVQGQQDAQMAQQQAEAEAQNAAMGGQPGGGSEGSPAGAEQQANPNGGSIGDMEPDTENPAGSELDQHIAKLESMVSKSETSPEDLKKAISDIKAFRVQAMEMKKSSMAISGIAKALHKPAFKIGKVASHNMNDNAKRAVGMQEKIVSDIMKSWEEEEKNASNSISKILGVEGLKKD